MGRMSTAARTELVDALAPRYAVGTRAEKSRILDESEAVTGFHRKRDARPAVRIARGGADVATGWTECAPELYREQTLLREVLGEVRRLTPFDLLGFDTDNASRRDAPTACSSTRPCVTTAATPLVMP